MILEATQFIKEIESIGEKAVQLIAKEAAGLAFTEVATRVMEATPVLTGRARGNWMCQSGEPANETTTQVAGVSHTGEPLTEQEKARIKEAVNEFLNNPSAMALYLTNDLSYIVGLEHGNSQKAPAGMVAVSIPAALEALRDKKVTAKISLEAVQRRAG